MAGMDLDDQAGWSGVRRRGFPQDSAPRVPLSVLETLNSGHLGPLDKHQDGLPNRRHGPNLNWTCNQAPVPTPPHPFTVSSSPLDGSSAAPPRVGTNKETVAVPGWPSTCQHFHVLFHPSSYRARQFVPVKHGGMLTPHVAAEEPSHHQVLAPQELFVNTPGVRSTTSVLEAGAHTSPGARPRGTLL